MRKPKLQIREPEKCWVNDTQKVCYGSEEEARGVARLVEQQHDLPPNSLAVYKCEHGEHWHLARQ